MLTRYNDYKTLTLSSHQLKGKNANAVLQAELLQLGSEDIIKLPLCRDARSNTLIALSNLGEETIKILIHKIHMCKHHAKEILSKLTWTTNALNILLATQEGPDILCEWYNRTYKAYYNQGTMSTPVVPEDIAIAAALRVVSDPKTSRYNSGEPKEILKKFVDKLDLIALCRNAVSMNTAFDIAIYAGKLNLVEMLHDAYAAAMSAGALKRRMLMSIAIHNFNSGSVPNKQEVITVHLELIQKIITLPEIIKRPVEDGDSRTYGGVVEAIYDNYGVGFSLLQAPAKIESPF